MKPNDFCILSNKNSLWIYDLCSSDLESCKNLNFWSMLVEDYMLIFNPDRVPLKYYDFLNKIKEM